MFSEIMKNLEDKGYKVSFFETSSDAAKYINSQIDNMSVAFGGSMTLKDMGLYESIKAHNNVLLHWIPDEGKTPADILKEAVSTEVYISSVNAIAKSGEIVNIDGTANRVASIFYGHKKVYLVVGKNKIAESCNDAIYRARNIAAPLNAKRLNRKTPCAEKGDKCYDCNSPERICCGLSVLWKKPGGCDYEIVIINEDIGY